MDIKDREIWFPARRWGWGWGLPIAWQGWLVYATYGGLLVAGKSCPFLRVHPIVYACYALALTASLMFVCWLKGEKTSWRWGGK
jgi:hypothetical protein